MLYLPRLCSSTPSVATTKYVRYNAYMHALTCTTHTHTQIQTAAHTHTLCSHILPAKAVLQRAVFMLQRPGLRLCRLCVTLLGISCSAQI